MYIDISTLQINLDYEIGRQSYMVDQFLKLSTFKSAYTYRVSAVTDATGTIVCYNLKITFYMHALCKINH